MRILTWLLLVGGLLLLSAGPVAAGPGTPARDVDPGHRACGVVEDAQGAPACERRLRLSARVQEDALLLAWHGSRATVFDLYYSSAPYVGYVHIDEVRATSYEELLAHVAVVEINDYYQVRERGSGTVSNRLGVFTFPLAG